MWCPRLSRQNWVDPAKFTALKKELLVYKKEIDILISIVVEELLGLVANALRNPIDGKGPKVAIQRLKV